jgi:hypothetical protein
MEYRKNIWILNYESTKLKWGDTPWVDYGEKILDYREETGNGNDKIGKYVGEEMKNLQDIYDDIKVCNADERR